MPEEMLLVSAYPNPFNPVTNVTFGIKLDAQLTVKVFDISGREVAELANGYYLAGYHSVDWQAADQSSGVYFLTVSTADVSHTQKLMLVK